ncbi:MAG: hypothetical protein R2845_13905 [Thermomicrobiales bacterium]
MSDSNTTAIAIQAPIAAGVDPSDESIQAGLAYLETVIDPEQGGFAYDANSGLIADANSTAVVIQALIAAGEDPASDEWGRQATPSSDSRCQRRLPLPARIPRRQPLRHPASDSRAGGYAVPASAEVDR